jgi:hypothetical protein
MEYCGLLSGERATTCRTHSCNGAVRMRLGNVHAFPFRLDGRFACQNRSADASQLTLNGRPAMEGSLVDFRLGKQSI